MKIYTPLLFLLLFSCQFSKGANNLTPSTGRQIFSLQKGDSLEYYTYTWELYPGCGLICDIYRLNVIDSTYYNNAMDTLYIAFNDQIVHTDTFLSSLTCDYCYSSYIYVGDYFVLTSGLWMVTDLDSSIAYLMDSVYGTVGGGGEIYSVYTDTGKYNGSKQNDYDYGYDIMSGFTEIYTDSLGIVYKNEEDQTATSYIEQLIYYHKANGEIWGTPSYIYAGIENIYEPGNIAVYPNPVNHKFIIHADQYQGLRFELVDVLSRRVMSFKLTGTETEVNRNNLPPGVYLWQTNDGTNTRGTGKLVLQ